ncbi:DUF2157 domain-containing protein [Myceligenerans indicum]|uniref:DUF2157 domain-containing protein n=1 Tax=Myceligenerans indicum TaxID=2593663 RepID=A0ABS1LL32_9MICO|nr:DUF2157 domain-containing protein [Myceligenerans indicum]MBL0886927.1 DUF2157 domain-containing protein [Myceligenerans indicum]
MSVNPRDHDRVFPVRHPGPDPVPAARLAEWAAAGIITRDQADLIAAHELAQAERRPAPRGGPSLLAEALGYVGGVVILVAAVLLATEFWEQLGTGGRLVVVGAAAGTMLVAGVAVPRRAGEQGRRLRAVLWAGATVAFAGFAALLASDALGMSGDDATLTAAAAAAAVASTLWWLRPTGLQHLVALLALAATVAATVAKVTDADYLPGVGVWTVGLAWFLLARAGLLRPRELALVLGSALAVFGALMTLPTDGGIALTLVTAVAIVAAAVWTTDLPLLGVGAVGLLIALPNAVQTWFGATFAAPVALLGAGLVLVVAALWIARRRQRPERAGEPPVGAPGDFLAPKVTATEHAKGDEP